MNQLHHFRLDTLMHTVFALRPGERVGVFIDLDRPGEVPHLPFLQERDWSTRRIAFEIFYRGLLDHQTALGLRSVSFYAYEPTGGSNLDLPPLAYDLRGQPRQLATEILPQLDIVLYLSTYSATAPITALAKQIGFRGATMHGCNHIILETGLAKNYADVSAKAERFRQALTRADEVVIEFTALGQPYRLTLELGRQEAQKSHGLCHTPGEIANLPAGEIYWVPTGAHGQFPHRFKDGTLAVMDVRDGRIHDARLLRGQPATVDAALTRFRADPATGELGELGLGTQDLPVAGADIQDEKILGTLHVATGRSDHLGGSLGPGKFRDKRNATHEDILFAPHKTPEIDVTGVWLHKDGQETLLIEHYNPTEFVRRVAL